MKLMLSIILFAVLVLGLWFGYSAFSYRTFSRSATENAQLAASRLLDRVGAEFSQMNTIAGVIAGSSTVHDFLSAGTAAEFFALAEPASEIIRNAVHPHSFVDSVVTFDADGTFFRFMGGLSNPACEELHYMVHRAGTLYTIVELDGVLFFCYSVPVYSVAGQAPYRIGTVVLLTHLDRTRVALVGGGVVPDIDTAVIRGGTILLSGDTGLEGKPCSVLDYIYGLVWRMPVDGTNLSVAAAVRYEALFPGRGLFLAASAVLLFIMAVSVVFLYMTLTGRQKLFDSELLQRDMRIGLLVSQIDAHFVVNTIASIHALSVQGENKKAAEMADGLAQILKHKHRGGEHSDIFLEFESIGRYIDVMNIRHDNRFSAEYDVDEGLSGCLIPCLVLQPIVENALTHGLRYKDGAMLNIRGYMKEDTIYIEIFDNGAGIGHDKLAELKAALEAADFGDFPEKGLTGVGLCNVHRRIRLRFGEGYGLSIDSALGEGTAVTVKFPAVAE